MLLDYGLNCPVMDRNLCPMAANSPEYFPLSTTITSVWLSFSFSPLFLIQTLSSSKCWASLVVPAWSQVGKDRSRRAVCPLVVPYSTQTLPFTNLNAALLWAQGSCA